MTSRRIGLAEGFGTRRLAGEEYVVVAAVVVVAAAVVAVVGLEGERRRVCGCY